MPKGPKGQYRPSDPVKSAMLVVQLATGQISEADARKFAPKKPKKRPVKKRQTASS